MEATQYNKQKIAIVGAGGFARELYSWIHIGGQEENFYIEGVFDDNDKTNPLDFGIDIPYLGRIDFSNLSKDVSVVIAINNCNVKELLFQQINLHGANLADFIHKSVLVGLNTSYGAGLVLFPNTIISCNVSIGDLLFVNCGSQIGHDVTIGNFVSIMANVDIGGGAQIGNNVFIGSNAVILPGVKIPDNTIIGAGSVVIRSIKQSGSYFGNPAKKIF